MSLKMWIYNENLPLYRCQCNWRVSLNFGVMMESYWNFDLVVLCRSVSGNSIADHLVYYGVDMGSDEPSSCRIVMDRHVQDTSVKDSRGNLILSRDPATPVIKLRREVDNQENPINVDWFGMVYLLHDRFQRFAVEHYTSDFFFSSCSFRMVIAIE